MRAQVTNSFLLLPLTNVWRYDASGLDLGADWRQPAYDDSAWPAGPGVLAFEDNNAATIALTNTVLPLRNAANQFITNFYFRTHFTLTNDPQSVILTTSNLIDDGAVFYLNGAEFARIRMPAGSITANTFAQSPPQEGVFTKAVIPAELLVPGDNVIAAEVHQNNATSSDVVFGMAIVVSPAPQGPPTITAQPTNATIFLGQNSTFSVTADGAAPLRFQWFKNGAAIPNATNNAYALRNVQGVQAGDYYAAVTNSLGAATSGVATLTVIGGSASLRLLEVTNAWRYDASGNDPGAAWRAPDFNDSAWSNGLGLFAKTTQRLPEPINTVLPLSNSSGNAIITHYFRTHFNLARDPGNLVLVASNLLDDGAVFHLNGSEAARLRVNGNVTASTLAANAPNNGATYEMIFVAATNLVAGDNVLAVETHQSSATNSDMVFGLNLRAYPGNNEPLTIVNQPGSQTANEGQPVSFFADVFGGQPVFYQWFQSGALLSGATNATLTLSPVHGANAGGYSFVASNSVTAVTSAVADLTVLRDQTPPTLESAFAVNDFNSVMVIFSEPVSTAAATNVANYSFSPDVAILSAQMIAPNRVLLTTSGRDVQFDYTLGVVNITDQSDSGNMIVPGSTRVGRDTRALSTGLLNVQTVFMIVMENQNWSAIKGSTNCPYINDLLSQASYCEQYYGHNNQHPSQPNYIWLEAGDNFGYTTDAGPSVDRVRSTNHLATLLNNAGIDWRGYMESMPRGSVGTNDTQPYLARHNPFAFFDDVTTNYDYCTNHVRPYSEFAGDLVASRIGRYNFIAPNVTNDMHTLAPGSTSQTRQGDTWLSQELPKILGSQAFLNNGAVLITWDESNLTTTNTIGMIVLSPLAKGGGYTSTTFHDHSSTLRSMQEIFRVRPYLGDAANANTLGDLFQELTLTPVLSGGLFGITLNNVVPGSTNYVQASSDLLYWSTILTNVPSGARAILDLGAVNQSPRFYRAIAVP